MKKDPAIISGKMTLGIRDALPLNACSPNLVFIVVYALCVDGPATELSPVGMSCDQRGLSTVPRPSIPHLSSLF